ncbi:hypothetical protein [Mycobacterium sp.]|uniref:MmyB family transcriptional regulator n=1 Tax=Mycobacterium sp. TaxID=1785 RepID=UPI003BAE17EB
MNGLREVAGSASNDPRMRALIDEFSAVSSRFRERWARADVGYRTGVTRVRHPIVGEIHLHVMVNGNPTEGWTLTDWDADPPPC